MSRDFDLLGDPIPENWGGRGRPAHIPTQGNCSKVRLLLAFGWTAKRIAQALRLTTVTLRKHYFAELRRRDEARPALEANTIAMVYKAAATGNVGAMKELRRMIERDELARVLPAMTRQTADYEELEKLGKKEAANRAAHSAHQGTTWNTLLQ